MPHRRIHVVLALAALACLAATAHAQFGRGAYRPRVATDSDFDGRFHFCRLVYQGAFNNASGNWTTDFPRADINMSIRLSELTKTNVSKGPGGEPNHLLVRPTDPELFKCPFVMMAAPGRALFDDEDAKKLREFLLKGGFLWADDFWGDYEWDHWEAQLHKVLPPAEYSIVDVPLEHAFYRTQFEVRKIPQIPNIGFFLRSGGGTSERGSESAVPHVRAIADRDGRIMVLSTHNTDIADSWEQEAADPNYFYHFGPDGYAFGINAVLYALTH